MWLLESYCSDVVMMIPDLLRVLHDAFSFVTWPRPRTNDLFFSTVCSTGGVRAWACVHWERRLRIVAQLRLAALRGRGRRESRRSMGCSPRWELCWTRPSLAAGTLRTAAMQLAVVHHVVHGALHL